MAIIMYDSIYPAELPPDAEAYAGYTGGRWPTFGTLQRMFPRARLLSIAVFASEDADCLDVESGDATIAQVYGWFLRQQARRVWRPVIYTSVVNVDQLVATMTANGFGRGEYRIWSAHYGAGQHACGPGTCRQTSHACDGTQWTDAAMGRSLDESVLDDSFFPAAPAPHPSPSPAPTVSKENAVQLTGEDNTIHVPKGAATMYLGCSAPQGAPCAVTVMFGGQGADAKTYDLSWGTGEQEIPVTHWPARIVLPSGWDSAQYPVEVDFG